MKEILAALLVWLFKWLIGRSVPTTGDASQPGDLEKKLREQLKKEGWL